MIQKILIKFPFDGHFGNFIVSTERERYLSFIESSFELYIGAGRCDHFVL